MELVYLWVEKYKNIEDQGFNFSPRYKCSYENGVFDIIDKETTNESYIKNFFGDNVNITAIIGKNGSGKSSFIEAMMLVLYGRFYKEYLFVIENDNKKLEYIAIKNMSLKNMNYIGKILPPEEDNHLNLISGLRKSFSSNHYIQGIISKTEEYYRGNMSYEQSVLIKMSKVFSVKPDCFTAINKDFVFDNVKLLIGKLNTNDIKKVSDNSQETTSYMDFSITLLDDFYKKLFSERTDIKNKQLKRINSPKLIPKDLTKLLVYNTLVGLTKIFLDDQKEGEVFLTILQKYKDNNEIRIIDIINDLQEAPFEIKEKIDDIINTLNRINNFAEKNSKKLIFKETIGFEETLNIADDFNMIETYIKEYFYLFKGFSEQFFELQMIEIKFIASKNQDISFFDLSDGEKRLLSQLIEVQYELLKPASRYLLLLDEPDGSLHPNWNKEFINLLLKSINAAKPIHFLISSHSPFILSDIPSQNTIFLDRDKKGNCKVLDGLKDKKQTFGANIHTLLSDAFFMEDGLMGDFAKEKINQVYRFITEYDTNHIKTKEEAQQIINIIGEPVLQKELQKLFDKHTHVDIDEQIKAHEDEIARLKAKKEKQ